MFHLDQLAAILHQRLLAETLLPIPMDHPYLGRMPLQIRQFHAVKEDVHDPRAIFGNATEIERRRYRMDRHQGQRCKTVADQGFERHPSHGSCTFPPIRIGRTSPMTESWHYLSRMSG